MIIYKEIEEKWQKRWEEAKAFESEPNEKNPLLVTAAFPYVNSPQHIGHIRTYGTADAYARYKRMRGFNVLYPFAFHATGTPLLAFAKRIKNNDPELINELKLFHVPENEILFMTDPKYIADYFIKETELEMREAGYGIDWRRKFISTEPLFSKFVEWQFQKLKEKNYLTKGKHPIGWCTNENNPVGQHDTKHDIQPEIQPITLIKFKEPETGIFFACATYRAETIYAVTNIFVDKKAQYVIAKINGERYYLSKESAKDLKYQFTIEIESEIKSEDLLSKKAINPINNMEVPVLPGFFVKPGVGTGIVMSVPSHAPFDYVAIQRLKEENYPMPPMEFKKIIEIEKQNGISIGRSLSDVNTGEAKPEHPEIPALAYLEILHANKDAIDDMIEFATKLSYREESHWGVMLIEEYKGMKEPEARIKIKEKLEKQNSAFEIYTISNDEPVYCRCGFRVIVKIVDDQWFINYGNPEWKKLANERLKKMKIYPEKLRLTFEKVIEWLDLRAAERSQGLGTKFPFNTAHIIESLSDSTIYMCFYTFVHILRNEKVTSEQLKPEFFDYVILSIGEEGKVADITGIKAQTIQKCRESFEYWYSNSSSHSAPDLIQNHLTMYIFTHVGLLKEANWPNQIVVNGFVNYEGEKMSKSLGNIIPLIDGIEKYGVDPLRFVEVATADLDTVTEFNTEAINSIHSKNEFLYKTILSLPSLKSKELSHIDYWLYSKLNSKIRNSGSMMENVNLKGAYTEIYYNSVNELKKYMERGGENEIVMREFLESITLMLAPAMPHIAEEFWEGIGKNTLVVKEKWPEVNEQMISSEEESIEEIIDQTISDLKQSIELTSKINSNKGKKLIEIRIIIADQWKQKAYSILSQKKNIGEVMKNSELVRVDKTVLSNFLSQFSKKLNLLTEKKEISMELLMKAFVEVTEYLGEKFNSRVTIENEQGSSSARAQRALPDKPSIDLIWG